MAQSDVVRIATRKSPLAMWQAEFVKEQLQRQWPALAIELVAMITQGDKILDSPLAKIGGKGLFVKELELGLINGDADIAVHSMKDVPAQLPDGLCIDTILKRADPRDAFVSNQYKNLSALPQGARLGTSSLRRQCQVLRLRPDLQVVDLRGNVGTRLAKLDQGNFDAIVLASAGLIRLDLAERIADFIEPEVILPAIGQGAIGIQRRSDDARIAELVKALDDEISNQCVSAERAFNTKLHGGCQAPIGGYAISTENKIWLRGLVGEPDGSRIIVDEQTDSTQNAQLIGETLASRLLTAGAEKILNRLRG